MVPLLLPLLVADVPRFGEVPHLAKDELAVVTESGGGRFYQARLAVLRDGTVAYAATLDRKPERRARWRLSPPELAALRRLVARTDFPTLHVAPRGRFSPSALDGIDRGLAVRQGPAVRGWTNTVWTEPERPVPLFQSLGDLITRSRTLSKG